MLPHLKLFVLLGAVLLSAWAVLRLRQINQRFTHPSLAALLSYSTIFTAALSVGFLFAYADLNLGGRLMRPLTGRTLDLANWLLSWVALAMPFYLATVVLGFLEQRMPRAVRIGALTVAAAIGMAYLTRIIWPAAGAWVGWVDWIRRWIVENILALELVFLVYLYQKSRRIADPLRRRMLAAFAVLYLARYLVAVLLLVGAFAVSLGDWARLPLSVAILSAYSYLPVFWAERYFVPCAERTPRLPEDEAWWESLVAEYRLSRRELEVLRHVLNGKTNRDIEALLGVSVHTVKNHVYNIFNKVGVESRYQLVHLLLNRRR